MEDPEKNNDKLSIKNFCERDNDIIFNPSGHKYTIKGITYDKSVTGLVKSLFGDFDAENIIYNIQRSRKMYSPDYEYYGMNAEQIKNLWNTQQILGSLLHKDIERFYSDLPPKNVSKEYDFFLNFVRYHPHLTPYRSEWMVYSERIKMCGSIDMVYALPNGHHAIYDWKRTKNINMTENYSKYCIIPELSHIPDTNYYHYSLQLNIYKYILETEYGLIIDCMYLVVLHPKNGNYIKYEVINLKNEIEYLFLDK